MHGGICQLDSHTFTCQCLDEYSGQMCEEESKQANKIYFNLIFWILKRISIVKGEHGGNHTEPIDHTEPVEPTEPIVQTTVPPVVDAKKKTNKKT